jgi:3-polyprenyl-4-hydroxybenzoate decarboxylase
MKAALLSLVIGLMVSVNAMATCQLQAMKNSNIVRDDQKSNNYQQVMAAMSKNVEPAKLESLDSRTY